MLFGLSTEFYRVINSCILCIFKNDLTKQSIFKENIVGLYNITDCHGYWDETVFITVR